MMQEWRPIGTAPTDGTRVLLWLPDTHGHHWSHTPEGGCVVGWAEPNHVSGHAWVSDMGEIETGGEDVWFAVSFLDPTHWMPLPSAPKK